MRKNARMLKILVYLAFASYLAANYTNMCIARDNYIGVGMIPKFFVALPLVPKYLIAAP